MRAVYAKITLKHPVSVVDGHTSAEFTLSEITIYDATLGDLVSAAVDQKTLGESMPVWCALTGLREDVLRRLKPYDAGQLAAHVEEIVNPFVQAKLELALKRAAEKATPKAAESTPTSGSS